MTGANDEMVGGGANATHMMPMPVVQEEFKQSDMPAIQAQAPVVVHPPADANVPMMDNTVSAGSSYAFAASNDTVMRGEGAGQWSADDSSD